MTGGRVEPELHALRKLAEELALRGKERLSTAHLLAAIADGATPAAELLLERRMGSDEILRLARATRDEVQEPIRAALARAHEIAVRMGQTQAAAAHLLVALLNEPRSAARRALEQAG
ncbi:MAG TPA: Clp protease N-terminal domain-containing protein, partial [Polyangiaceae bacterium]